MRQKKIDALNKMVSTDPEISKHSPFKKKCTDVYSLFVRRRSSAVCKLLTNKPSTAVAILKHVWDQEYKDPQKRVFMNKYWKRCDTSLARLMLDIGKSKAKKDDTKLLSAVNKVKQKYNSLRQASKVANISWTTFHRNTYVKKDQKKKLSYSRKLTDEQVRDIQAHFVSDDISFPLPEKKYQGKRFMCNSVQKFFKMYNLLHSTTHKISLATYYRYKPKGVKFQGKIPFRQSCCEKCQNVENIIEQASKYMLNIPRDVGGCVDRTLCTYNDYFPQLPCILRTCKMCSTKQFYNEIVESNKAKMSDTRKRFLIKQWITTTVKKNGATQSFLHWKFERCSYKEMAKFLTDSLEKMAEHSFNASWNYVQYKQAKKNIRPGDVIFVHDFAQNYLCQHQRECQGLHWRHEQVTLMPTVAHYVCPKENCDSLVTHEIVHVSEDLKHDAHLVKQFTTKSISILKENKIPIRKIIEFTDQAPSQYKNKTAFRYMTQSKIPIMKNYFGVHHGKSSCDACTGRVKQGVSRLVRSEIEVVNSAKTFHTACVKHLAKPPKLTSGDCQHYMLTFELHAQLHSRPKLLIGLQCLTLVKYIVLGILTWMTFI